MSSKSEKKSKKEKTPTIAFSIGDYLTVDSQGKKYLVTVTKKSDSMCAGVNQKHAPYVEEEITFENDEVLANYGVRPGRSGYEVHLTSSRLSGIGELNFFVKLSSAERDEIKDVVKKGHKALDKKSLASFFPLNFEIRAGKGKALGYYSLDMKTDIDTMGFRMGELQDLTHTFYHEAAHGIWERLVTKRSTKAKWISLYNEFIDVESLSTKHIRRMYEDFASMACSMTEYKASLKEDEGQEMLLKEVLSYIKKYHRLSIKDLDILADSDDKKTIKKLWPNDAISLTKEKETGISLYSLKSPLELFCESFAFYMTGKGLPKTVKKLLSKTLQEGAV